MSSQEDKEPKNVKKVKVVAPEGSKTRKVADPQEIPFSNRLLPSMVDITVPTESMYSALSAPENATTRKVLFVTTAIMVVVPLLAFYFGYYVFFANVTNGGRYSNNDSLTYSGFAAAGAANVVLIGYVVYALCFDPARNEGYDEIITEEQDKKNK